VWCEWKICCRPVHARPLSIPRQYRIERRYRFRSHMLQRSFDWSIGKVSAGCLSSSNSASTSLPIPVTSGQEVYPLYVAIRGRCWKEWPPVLFHRRFPLHGPARFAGNPGVSENGASNGKVVVLRLRRCRRHQPPFPEGGQSRRNWLGSFLAHTLKCIGISRTVNQILPRTGLFRLRELVNPLN